MKRFSSSSYGISFCYTVFYQHGRITIVMNEDGIMNCKIHEETVISSSHYASVIDSRYTGVLFSCSVSVVFVCFFCIIVGNLISTN